jgi:hypothetical protein
MLLPINNGARLEYMKPDYERDSYPSVWPNARASNR